MTHKGQKELRAFGLLVGGIFSVTGLWPVLFHQEPARTWALGVGLGLVTLAFIAPRSLKQVYHVWMTVGSWLGWINSRILLAIIFYALVTPMGMVMRLFGWDPLRLKFEPQRDTYRIVRSPRPRSHMRRQF